MEIGQRIIIIGTTGAGKSTLAGQLSQILDIPHIELDGLFWKPDWEESTTEEFRQKVEDTLKEVGDKWVSDGNGRRVRDIVWNAGDTLIWLDYPLYVTLPRLFFRTVGRVVNKTELWNGNRETFSSQFFSQNSLFVWAFKNHNRLKKIYTAIIEEKQFPNLQVLHFKHPRELESWLKQLQATPQMS